MATGRFLLFCVGLALTGALRGADGLDRAQELYHAHRYAEAQELFERVAADEPDNVVALHYLGRLARTRQDLAAAYKYLGRARELAPEDANVVFDYGATASLYAETQGMSIGAAFAARAGRSAMERAVELDPENLDYRQALLEFYANAPGIVGGSLKKAHEQATAIGERDARRGTYAQGNLLIQEKRYDEALTIWRELRKDTPDDYWVLYQIGRTLAAAGGPPDEGIAALQRCLALPRPEGAPGPSRVNWYLARLQREKGDIPAAREAYRAALAIEPLNQEMATEMAKLPSDR